MTKAVFNKNMSFLPLADIIVMVYNAASASKLFYMIGIL